MTVKRAHMVSKGYLRPWAEPTKSVDVLDLQDGRGYVSSLANATVIRYGYDPSLLNRDLEHEYSRIENRGIPALVRLRLGHELSAAEKTALIAFLDMHLDRGRYADQIKENVPAVVVRPEGVEETSLSVGDRLLLSQSFSDVIRLVTLGLEEWPWKVMPAKHLATGDGAVLLWGLTDGAPISTVSFPLSPNELLVIGQDLPPFVDINSLLERHSRRWIIGVRGSLRLDQAAVAAAGRHGKTP